MKSISMLLALLLSAVSVCARTQQLAAPPAANATKATKPAATKTGTVPPEKAQPVGITRFDKPPAIDGKLDEEVWKSASVLKDFYQTQPGDNISPSQRTEVLLGYDSKFLYVAFKAYDEAGKVRATVAKRDAIFDDDNVRIVLDTFNDQRKAYIFGFNPFGVQADGILTEGSGEDYSVDVLMESKGVVTEDGYFVEVAIPFKSLRYAAGKGKNWGVHAFRRIKRFDNELNSWMPISRDISGLLNQSGRITGLENIASERVLEIIPTFTISETGKRIAVQASLTDPLLADRGRFLNKPAEFDPGVNVKLGITQSVILDFAANPDFAQVEADQPVITANQRFPIFFAEKRPFFLEGIDIFQTPLTAVHTRAIVDPDYAAKLTGKVGRNSFGVLLASDNAPGNYTEEERTNPDILPRIERFLDKNAYIGVLRAKRDVGKESSIGLIGTSYNFIERHNHLAGIDGRFKVDKQTTLNFQVLGTNSRRFFYEPDEDQNIFRTGNGFAYNAAYFYGGRNFRWELYGEGKTRDYRADVGFNSQTNTNFNSVFFGYNSTPKPKATLISYHVHNFTHIDYDFQGRMQIWESEFAAELGLSRQTYIGGGYERAYERVFEEEFGAIRTVTRAGAFFGDDSERSSDKHHFFLWGGTKPSKKFGMDFRVVYRAGHLDYDFGAGRRFPRVSPAALVDPEAALDPGRGGLFEFRTSMFYQPSDALNTTFSFVRNRLTRYDTGLVAFDDNLFSSRTTYQFTRFLFARARLDYLTLSSRVRGQYLIGWTPSPGTSFYAGYNDDMNYNGFSPFTGIREDGLRLNGRTFFIKTSYLFRRSL
ncbi:MAG TPA: DUF5916 domain-containing protein [Blastocatellia bacterium]|nr:DUF5916 domain-containing protein [Blastocatellia bacterium]